MENLRSWFQAVFSHKIFRVALNMLCKYRTSLTQGQFLRIGIATYLTPSLGSQPILFCILSPNYCSTVVYMTGFIFTMS